MNDAYIITMGALLPPDAAIDQLRGRRLILWDRSQVLTGLTIDYGFKVYASATLDPEMERALRLPLEPEDFGSTEALVRELRAVVSKVPGIDEPSSLLVALAVIGSWVTQCLAGPLIINLYGAVVAAMELFRVLGCVCRRPLHLSDPSVGQLAGLPAGIDPTLFLLHPNDRALGRLVTAVGYPGTFLFFHRRAVSMRCSVVTYTSNAISIPALKVFLGPEVHAVKPMMNSGAEAMSQQFQSRLLQYRLVQHIAVGNSQFDAPQLSPELRIIARTLGAAIEGCPAIQSEMIAALEELHDRQTSPECEDNLAVVESLFRLSHSESPTVYVGKLAEYAVGALGRRGERMVLSPKAVGRILRQELGLLLTRRSLGYELALDGATKRKVHHVAQIFGVLQPVAACSYCREISSPTATDVT